LGCGRSIESVIQTGTLLSEDVNEDFKDVKAVWIHDYDEFEVR